MIRRFGRAPFSMATVMLLIGVSPRGADPPQSTPGPVSVVLPASLDPTGAVRSLEHGTRVYSVPQVIARYEDVSNGKPTIEWVPIRGYTFRAELRPDKIYVVTDSGLGAQLPYNVQFFPVKGHDFVFEPPNETLPVYLKARKPDYVVP